MFNLLVVDTVAIGRLCTEQKVMCLMKLWDKKEIEVAGGAKVLAQMPLIVSASRSTDVPAFYSDWFMGN